jgi:hypothetical protein
MGAVGAAVAGGVASAAVGTAGSALMGGKAGAGAGQAQQVLQQQRADLAPYHDAGIPALTAQNALLGLSGPDAAAAAMANYQTSPGYQWQLQQGLQATDAGAAARGMLRSGAALKAEQTFGQGLANTDFGQYYQRLAGLSTLGEQAAAGGASTANQAGVLAQGAGNTQASIYGDLAKGLGGTANTLLQNPDVKNWLFGDTVSPSTVSNNALYQQGAFQAAGPGAWGPFQ